MAVFTNVSAGPRVVNVKAGVNPVTKAKVAKHHLLMPGESADLDVEDENHPAFKGLLDSKQLIRGMPDAPPADAADLAALQANHELLAAQLAEAHRSAEEARAKGMARISDLEKQLADKDAAHTDAIAKLQAEHEAQVASLTAPPKK